MILWYCSYSYHGGQSRWQIALSRWFERTLSTWNNLQNHTKSFTIAAFPNNSASAVQTFTQQNFTVTNTGVVGGIELDANDPQLFKDDGGGNRASFTVQNGGVGAYLAMELMLLLMEQVEMEFPIW